MMGSTQYELTPVKWKFTLNVHAKKRFDEQRKFLADRKEASTPTAASNDVVAPKEEKSASASNGAVALKVRKELSRLLKKGLSMKRLRQTNKASHLERCGNMMRNLQPQVDKVRAMSDEAKLALDEKHGYLGYCVNEAHACVSCSKSAETSCSNLKKSLANKKMCSPKDVSRELASNELRLSDEADAV